MVIIKGPSESVAAAVRSSKTIGEGGLVLVSGGFVGAGCTGVGFRDAAAMGPAVAASSGGGITGRGAGVVTAIGDGKVACSLGGSKGSGSSVHLELKLGHGGSEGSDLGVVRKGCFSKVGKMGLCDCMLVRVREFFQYIDMVGLSMVSGRG